MDRGTWGFSFTCGATGGVNAIIKSTGGRQDVFNNTASTNEDYEIRNKNSGSIVYAFNIMGLSNNIKFGAKTLRATTEGTNHLDIFDGTAPVGTLANGCSIYSASGELWTMDAGGTATQQTPHDGDGKWIFHSKNTVTGEVLKIDMERFVKAVNEKLGMDFVHEYVEK
jgi:hypothetical protein